MGYVQGITGIAQVRTFSVLLHCSSTETQCFILCTLLLLDGGSSAGRLDGRQIQTGLHPERGSCIGCHCWCKLSNHTLVQAACECAVWRLCFAWHLHWCQQRASGSPICRLHSKGEKVGPFAGHVPLLLNSNASVHCLEACIGTVDTHAQCSLHQAVNNAHVQQCYAHFTVLTYVHLSLETTYANLRKWCSEKAA